MASGPCARPLPAPGVPSSNPAFHTSERAAREGEEPTQGHPPTKEWSGQRERWLKLGVEQPGFQSQHCRQLAAKPRVSYPATLSLGFPVRKQLISVKNAPFHPRGTLAGKQPGRMAALLGSAKSQLPSALLRSPLAPRWAREGSVQARRRQGGRRGLPDCAQGCEKPSRPQRAGGTPGRPSLPSPPDPCRAGTQGPAVRLPRPGGLCSSVSSGNSAVARQPATRAPQARSAPGSPVGEGVAVGWGNRDHTRWSSSAGLAHLGGRVPARREAGPPLPPAPASAFLPREAEAANLISLLLRLGRGKGGAGLSARCEWAGDSRGPAGAMLVGGPAVSCCGIQVMSTQDWPIWGLWGQHGGPVT